jgi:hypothetical protein
VALAGGLQRQLQMTDEAASVAAILGHASMLDLAALASCSTFASSKPPMLGTNLLASLHQHRHAGMWNLAPAGSFLMPSAQPRHLHVHHADT